MAEFFSLEKLPNSDKKIRVVWDTNEYEYDEASEHEYGWRARDIVGIGEDGSEWIMPIEIESESDAWDSVDDASMTSTTKNPDMKLHITDNKTQLEDRYWDEDGRLQWPNKGTSREVSVGEYFKLKVGDYPNIDVKKGPHWLERQEMRKDPEIMLLSLMSRIPKEKIAPSNNVIGAEFYKVPEIINGEEKNVTVPTKYGLIKNLLNANNYTWQNEIKPEGLNQDDFRELKRKIITFLF